MLVDIQFHSNLGNDAKQKRMEMIGENGKDRNSDLLYKMLRFDNKLVRTILEANGFTHTESHEWNVLWSSSSCKSYLYEGLNEY